MHNNLKSVVHSHNLINNSNQIMTAKGDSGATSNYLRKDHENLLQKIHRTNNGPSVILPNDDVIQATSTGQLQLHPNLSSRAQKHIFSPIWVRP